jgi:hypothetical protein
LGEASVRIILALLLCVSGLCVCGPAAQAADEPMDKAGIEKTIALIQQWLGGNYSTKAQYEADQASDKPDNEKHRLMYQLFKRVEVPGLAGTIFFEQGSRDGSTDPDMIWRSGFAQILPDETLGVVRFRELEVKDKNAWRNAHLDPQKLKSLSAKDVTWEAACDFLIKLNPDGTSIGGPIPKMQCSRINEGTGERMYADDAIVIKPGEFWFLGRYVDAKGQHVWGNESDELNKLVKFADIP